MSCTKEFDCYVSSIEPRFIHYVSADLDTLILRKFKAENNFHTLIDTLFILAGRNGTRINNNDSTTILMIDKPDAIQYGYDWQLCIPSTNKTISISNIISEKIKKKRVCGVFCMNPGNPGAPCLNKIYSCRLDSTLITFSDLQYHIDISK